MSDELIDRHYYQVARPGSLSERLVVTARDAIYSDFVRLARPRPNSTVLDVGVSDVVNEAANVLERKYPSQDHITAVGIGAGHEFQAAFPRVRYQRIEPGQPLPFADKHFDIATSNAVLEHVGSVEEQHRFLSELVRVSRSVFVSVPNRFFPVEHHTGIPLLHWAGPTFRIACQATGKSEWTRAENLMFVTRRTLRTLGHRVAGSRAMHVGWTGLRLGPCSSNLYMWIGA